MMSVEQLAKTAYEAHVRAVAPRMAPTWEQLETHFKAGWIAAVQAVRAELDKH